MPIDKRDGPAALRWLLLAFLSALLLGGCGGGGDGDIPAPAPQPVAAATLARTEIAQTLVQSAADPKLVIAPGKPFVIRAYFAVPDGAVRPARFFAVVKNTANPAGAEVNLACPATLPATYPLAPAGQPDMLPTSMTGVAAAACTARIYLDPRGSTWAASGLQITLRATGADGSDAMAPVTHDVAAKVLGKRLVLRLCPRIITDASGDGLSVESVSNRLDLKAAILSYFPFADVQFCPDAFTLLPIRDLNLVGQPGVPTGSNLELNQSAGVDVLVAAMEQYRRARRDGYAQFVHVALVVATDSTSPDFDARNPVHGVANNTGGMSAVVYAPRDMAGGPRYYFQYQLVFMHELGHILGLFHSPGCGANGFDPAFPYAVGPMPSNVQDLAVRPKTALIGSLPRVPLRATIGDTHGYQLYDLSNRLSVGYSGIQLQSPAGTIYDASHHAVVGPGAGEIPVSALNQSTRNATQVYDLMNYCSSYAYNKWIADYSYFKVVKYTLARLRTDGGFDDMSGKISF